jgi:uncharacterized membrane protein
MPCLAVILGLLMPRLVLLVLAVFTNVISQSMSCLWAFIGFLLVPYTTLAYIAAMIYNNHEVSGGWTLLIIIALLIDLTSDASSSKSNN